MLVLTATLLTAILLGSMVFFPAVVAPLVFRVLEADDAGRFLRALFPRYYLFMVVTAGLSGIALLVVMPAAGLALLVVAGSTLVVREALVPKLNAWRDAELAGSESAGRRFAIGHRVSVIINMAQLLVVVAVLVALLLPAA